nr:RNA-directed DNA polymerase, eukaryota, reverse transcriptase zinc-binding domain protein [Tanacetum cinerariifolium]
MSWIRWDSLIASYGLRGEILGRLKQTIRLLSRNGGGELGLRGRTLWVRVLKSIYGYEGVLGEFVRAGDGVKGVWGDIVKVGRNIDKMGIEFSSSFVKKVGDRSSISFWGDRWVDGVRLMDRYPRLFHLDRFKESVVANKGRWDEGTWIWVWDWVKELGVKVKTAECQALLLEQD